MYEKIKARLETSLNDTLVDIADKYNYHLYIGSFSYSFYSKDNHSPCRALVGMRTESFNTDENSLNIVEEFTIDFCGYGTRPLEEENQIFEGLIKAKKMCDELNATLRAFNKAWEAILLGKGEEK